MPAPPAARWDKPALASLSLLRRVSREEARRARRARRVRDDRGPRRVAAQRALSRTHGFAGANRRMLTALAGAPGATPGVSAA
jgi:hypothetical protein